MSKPAIKTKTKEYAITDWRYTILDINHKTGPELAIGSLPIG